MTIDFLIEWLLITAALLGGWMLFDWWRDKAEDKRETDRQMRLAMTVGYIVDQGDHVNVWGPDNFHGPRLMVITAERDRIEFVDTRTGAQMYLNHADAVKLTQALGRWTA